MPVKDLKEFIACVKSKPADSLSYGSWGNRSGGHRSMEALKQQVGLKRQPIALKTPEQFAETVKTDIRDWGAIVRAGNIKAD